MGAYVRAADNAVGYELVPMFRRYPKGNIPWRNIVPEAIYWGARLASEAGAGQRLPVFIISARMVARMACALRPREN